MREDIDFEALHKKELEEFTKREKETENIITLLTILDKYGKLRGTQSSPAFSDRACIKEIMEMFKP